MMLSDSAVEMMLGTQRPERKRHDARAIRQMTHEQTIFVPETMTLIDLENSNNQVSLVTVRSKTLLK